MRLRETLFCVSGILFFSFLLNFFWESVHGYSLYADHVIASDKYVGMMVYVSLMDALTVLGAYLICAAAGKDVLWLTKNNRNLFIYFFALGIIVGAGAEYWAVYAAHEWHYNDRMPVVLGIGLSPLLQLGVTGLLAVWLTARLLKCGQNNNFAKRQ